MKKFLMRMNLTGIAVLLLLSVGCSDDTGMRVTAFYAERTTCHAGDPVRVYLKLADAPSGVSNHYAFIQGAGTVSNEGMSALITLTNSGFAIIQATATAPDGGHVSETLEIYGSNDPPEVLSFTADATTILKGQAVNLTVSARDLELSPLYCSYSMTPEVGSVRISNMSAVYTAPTNWSGTVTINLKVHDGVGGTATDSVELTVLPSWTSVKVLVPVGYYFSSCRDSAGNLYTYLPIANDYGGSHPLERSQDSGLSWDVLAGSGEKALSSSSGLISVDGNDIPHVLYGVASTGLMVSMYSNGGWIAVTPSVSFPVNDIMSYRTMGVGSDGVIVFSISYWSGSGTQSVSVFSNGSWQTLPVILSDANSHECVRLPDSSIWFRNVYGGQQKLYRWNGSSWVEQAQPASGSLFVQKVQGELWAAQDGAFYRYTGGSWVNEFTGATGLLAIGVDGAYHVYHPLDSDGNIGYTIRDGVKTVYNYGQAGSTLRYPGLYALGNPSKPYLIAWDYHANAIEIFKAE